MPKKTKGKTKKGTNYEYMPFTQADKEKHDRQKEEIMSEDEIQRSLEYQDWFKAAWSEKENRGLFELWSDIDDGWEGNLNIQQFEDDPASNTNIIHPNIEGQIALLVDDEIEIDPQPLTPSEKPYIGQVKTMLDFVKANNKMPVIMDRYARRLLKYGSGILMTKFDPKWLDGFGLPKIRSCNPFYVYPDPNITDIEDIQEGRFIIETFTKSISWAMREFGYEKASCIVPGYEPTTQAQYFGESSNSADYIGSKRYIHMFIWEKYLDDKGKVKLRLTQMSSDGTILWDSETANFKFPNSEFPYFFTPCYAREGTVWAKSTAELLMDMQMQLNDYDDQIRANARLFGNTQKWADVDIMTDGLDMWTNEAGLVLPVHGDGRAALGYLQPPPMNVTIPNRRDRIMDLDAQKVTRFYEQMVGGRQKGVDTATEAMQMHNQGMAGMGQLKKLIGDTMSDLFEYIYEMCLFYWKDTKMFEIPETKSFMPFNPQKLKSIPVMTEPTESFIDDFRKRNPEKPIPDYMAKEVDGMSVTKKAKLKINVKVGQGISKNPAFVYTAMKEAYAMSQGSPEPIVTTQEMTKYLANNLGLPIAVEKQMPNQQMPMQNMGQPSSMNMPNGTTNISGVQTKAPSQTPNAMVQGLNANDIVKVNGGGGL